MEVGEIVPDFAVTLDSGETVTLSALVERGPLVIFFYPRAFTPGCTAEACHFRDRGEDFARFGAQRVGVSRDDLGRQQAFAAKHRFDFPLVADEDGAVARIFGAKRLGPLWSRRETFVVGRDRQLLGAFRSETDMERHADEALRVLAEAASNGPHTS